ncbi:hypothetical protein [Lignipirellula cremea]|uniref:Uncharacterized protein n=1 Tax=Lignipirellula cremea TaxID=2528010 RepID=A0A518DZC2_9BACT|nr:hypothetical protein [Lignipirellula cremea]QDU97183.1 hypothetical protein Pla8534_50280 [Lignipirellula cremea]
MTFNNESYGATFAEFLQQAPPCALTTGPENHAVKESLEELELEEAFAPHPIIDHTMAACCLSGLWLLHNFLEHSHALSQDVASPSGSYWHAIMHRREPDYSNAKYWFRQTGDHPAYLALAIGAQAMAEDHGSDPRLTALTAGGVWRPERFVDLCEAAATEKQLESVCLRIAELEWRLLFDYCYGSAIGAVS